MSAEDRAEQRRALEEIDRETLVQPGQYVQLSRRTVEYLRRMLDEMVRGRP